ncbi:L-type lectin-domain containing receptor kinase IX.1-like protein [Tanacetum coccineum]
MAYSSLHNNKYINVFIIATVLVLNVAEPCALNISDVYLELTNTNFSSVDESHGAVDYRDQFPFPFSIRNLLVPVLSSPINSTTELPQDFRALNTPKAPEASRRRQESGRLWKSNSEQHNRRNRSNHHRKSTNRHSKKKKRTNKKIARTGVTTFKILPVLSVVLIIFFLIFVIFFFLRKNKKKNNRNDLIGGESSTETFKSCSPRAFTFEDLSQATNNFHQDRILGVGGFGAVHKAIFPNGQIAAVKRVSSASQQGMKEYKAEVTIVSRLNHKHLVKLIGWCHEREGELLVVYELMENKSLDFHLFHSNMAPVAWDVRYKIAQGLAKALRYLHEECGQHCVLHMDIKSSNVLLDSNFEPKLGDFGLAKLVDFDRSFEVSIMAGTRGYLAPECVLTGKIRTHSDVYSYGVVALELATGRKTIDLNAAEEQKVLVKWVQNLYKAGRVMEVVDPKLGDDYDELQVKGLVTVGLWCVLHDFHERPSMGEIVRVLDNTEDPLSDIHEKIPSLVRASVTHDFVSVVETSARSSNLIAPMDLETHILADDVVPFSGDTVHPETRDHTYSPLFVWRRISVLYLLRYFIGITWFRSSHSV